ncbi:BMP family ABC transporter substrate-binding protein [Nocardia wallacei]|uniref:BMP family ABC transporter substrate-binding protein n=1 Tax=Nocardia wallacei TaxID=480035 RepID=UPI0024581C0F|nr:BMP family ABC transporter substrate-binding protein [Nocardia wallacei]
MAAFDALPRARRALRVLGAAVAALLLPAVTACGGGSSAEAGAAEIIYVTNAPIGQNQFLALGKTGTEQAAAALGASARTFESTDEQSRRANLEAAIARRPLAIVLITYEFNDLAAELAEQHPGQQFVLVDSCPPRVPENLRCGKFKEYESSYLLGVEAGLLTRTGRIGTVAAKDFPFFHRWSDAFTLGARSVNHAGRRPRRTGSDDHGPRNRPRPGLFHRTTARAGQGASRGAGVDRRRKPHTRLVRLCWHSKLRRGSDRPGTPHIRCDTCALSQKPVTSGCSHTPDHNVDAW